MYFVDHNPPHFHAIYQGKMAEYDIRTLDVISGKIPSRAHAMVLEWASLHKEELLANWKKASVPEPLKKIKPLN
jgi:hypothetical protein